MAISLAHPARTTYTELPRTAQRWRLPSSEWLLFALFVGPNLFFFTVFSFWPIIYSFWLSFHRWDLIAPVKKLVGLDNFRYLLHDDVFHTVILNTFVYTVGAVGGTMILGLLVALLLNQPLRFRDGARAVGLGDITVISQVGYGGGAGCGVGGHAAMAVATLWMSSRLN